MSYTHGQQMCVTKIILRSTKMCDEGDDYTPVWWVICVVKYCTGINTLWLARCSYKVWPVRIHKPLLYTHKYVYDVYMYVKSAHVFPVTDERVKKLKGNQ